MVSYEEKTQIMWDMKAGAQKATFTLDKVEDLDVALIFEVSIHETAPTTKWPSG